MNPPAIPLHILKDSLQALREVNSTPYGQAIHPRLSTRVARAVSGLGRYVADAKASVTVAVSTEAEQPDFHAMATAYVEAKAPLPQPFGVRIRLYNAFVAGTYAHDNTAE